MFLSLLFVVYDQSNHPLNANVVTAIAKKAVAARNAR
jgi:hypothetical protein